MADYLAQPLPHRSVDPAQWGVDTGYHDAMGSWHTVPDATIEAVLSVMGADSGPHPDTEPVPMVTVRLDHELPPFPRGLLHLEDGGELRTDGPLPPDLPTGYHRMEPDDGPGYQLLVSPGRCPSPQERQWGWAAQLYATRSRDSWGMGDLADLHRLNEWSQRLGAGMTLVNPLHAAPPGPHVEPSPYFASSRCFANPIYLRVEDVPGAEQVEGLDELAGAGRALNDGRRIDRDRVWALKSQALASVFERCEGRSDAERDPAFGRYCTERGDALTGFATFNALAEIYGLPWQSWPQEFRRPTSAAVAEFSRSREGARRIRWHAWLQWHTDRQLAHAAAPVNLVQDLAIGVNDGGADSWLYQDTFASGMRVGAPPDEFNTQGQDWGLPPWDPWRLRGAAYGPFIETVRGGLRHAGGLRFDHVMGLFRLFWIPSGVGAAEGTYVRYPYWDLLNILALEAERANAFVVGEDLGTVEDHVRAELAERQVLSYRLFWFEPGPPATWPPQALGAVTTHDLPTVAGVWSGSDLQAQRGLGLAPNEEGSEALRRRLKEWTGASDGSPVEEVIAGAYRTFAEAPCQILTASLDDVALNEERPNMPGTTDQWPNWSIPLPVPLEDLETSSLAEEIASDLSAAIRRGTGPTD